MKTWQQSARAAFWLGIAIIALLSFSRRKALALGIRQKNTFPTVGRTRPWCTIVNNPEMEEEEQRCNTECLTSSRILLGTRSS